MQKHICGMQIRLYQYNKSNKSEEASCRQRKGYLLFLRETRLDTTSAESAYIGP